MLPKPLAITFAHLALVAPATAHIAMWDKGMFGLNYPNKATDKDQHYNQNAIVTPLREEDHLKVDDWFGHGARKMDLEPAPGDFLVLPANGVLRTEHACTRAMTDCCGWPNKMDQPKPQYACESPWGAMHTDNKKGDPNPSLENLGGAAIAIAYESDLAKIAPNDMTVISVNYTSVWERVAYYPMPALPPCPEKGCICTWNWFHRAQGGYVSEMYNTMFRCRVENAVAGNKVPFGQAKVPVLCENKTNECVTGPKTPMYAYQAEGNNIFLDGTADKPPEVPPSYNERYGFKDGAQHDAVLSP